MLEDSANIAERDCECLSKKYSKSYYPNYILYKTYIIYKKHYIIFKRITNKHTISKTHMITIWITLTLITN